MTDEQIKQNAHGYTYVNNHNWTWDDSGESRVDISSEVTDAFIEGAHSRDEEVEELQNELESLRKGFYERGDKLKELMLKNNELHKPWISVEERLPKEGKCVFVRYGDVSHSLYSSAYMIEKNLWSIEGYGYGEVTHWMPIPRIKKGGEK